MASPGEVTAMRRAIELSRRATLTTPPGADVGCVVLDPAGDPAGEGWFEHPGGPHAEVVALRAAGERARGGTAVVTLEPCAHTGRTGPCTEALAAAGVARVVYAVDDPHPVAGGGAGRLRAAGVDVEGGVLAEDAASANARWLLPFRLGRPFVVWKFAATLDGRSAAVDGTSRWITGAAARADVHRLRASVDTVAVGVGTVLADDPQLTARAADDGHSVGAGHQPLRVVFDTHGRTPATARVRDASAPSAVLTAAETGVGPDGHLDLHKALAVLYERGSRYVLLEGGPRLAGAFWSARLVDRVVGYVAPALLGAGPAALAGAGVTTIADAIRLDVTDVTVVGSDIRITANPRG